MAKDKKAGVANGHPDPGDPLSVSSLTLSRSDLAWLASLSASVSGQMGQSISKSQIVRALLRLHRGDYPPALNEQLMRALRTEGRVWGSFPASRKPVRPTPSDATQKRTAAPDPAAPQLHYTRLRHPQWQH